MNKMDNIEAAVKTQPEKNLVADVKSVFMKKMNDPSKDIDTSDLGSEIISAISDILNGDDYLYYSYTGYRISISGYGNDVTIDFRFGYLTTKSQESFVDSKIAATYCTCIYNRGVVLLIRKAC
ncbi:hypothetical protein [Clostridium kluyveri]|uniref:hypothetical protein n=1 Tax=Clostridium kluyveri TaxID=1534 RepID=UPI001FA86CEE|nr:hypothetical protein [Clostridium kluyveri]